MPAVRNRDDVLELLAPYLQLGYTIKKACDLAEVPDSTVFTWLNDGSPEAEQLRAKIVAMQNRPKAKAREVIIKSITNGNVETSKWFLERTERDEFSTKTEVAVTVNEAEKKSKQLDGILNDLSKDGIIPPTAQQGGDTKVTIPEEKPTEETPKP